MTKRIATVLALTAGLTLIGGPVAQARPVIEPNVTRSDVGPKNPNWYCTYQVRFNDTVCVPGAGTAPRLVPESNVDIWWRWIKGALG